MFYIIKPISEYPFVWLYTKINQSQAHHQTLQSVVGINVDGQWSLSFTRASKAQWWLNKWMFQMESGNSVVYDTCGISKVEIGDLAEIIKALLNKDAKILRPEVDKDTEQDIYVGSRAKIKSLISELKINESSLEDQILCTAQYLKAILKLQN